MSFAWPHLLYLLIVPIALLWGEWRRRQHQRTNHHPKILQAKAGQQHLQLSGQGVTKRSRARHWLYVGLIFSVFSLARPQWGQLEEPVFDQSREILIAIDLSRSMLAQDIKPSRLDRAKLLISSLLEKLEGERVGLIVFSGTAFLQSPLSADYEILREFLPTLDPEYLPKGGTNYQALVETALAAFATSGSADRFLIVLSDGEATDENWQELIEKLKTKNIRTLSLGIGTASGAMIPDGSGAFVKDDRGAVVLSKLAPNTLRDLAQQTNGVYQDASSWVDLSALLKETVEAGRKGEFVEKNTVRLVERYQWPLAFALLCMLMSLWREFPVHPRPRALKISAPKTAALLIAALLLSPHSTSQAQEATPEPELTPLGKIVSRLSGQANKSGRDWAELARETVTWGQKLQTEQQPIPPVPVRDALQAVELGSKLDPKTADWTKLRSELEALLQKSEEQQKQEQQDQENQDQESDQQNQSQDGEQSDEQNSSQEPQEDSEGSSEQDQTQQSDQQEQSSENESGSPDDEQEQEPQEKESAFGDMNEEQEPPEPQEGEMQQVGGAEQDSESTPEQMDPSLAVPLQKLQKIRNQDSPAKLFQMMDDSPESSPQQKGKTW